MALAINAAQNRLMFAKESGDEGWYGSFAHALFNVDPTNPYLPTGREIGRIEVATVCKTPVNIQNPFYEFLEFGNGYQPRFSCFGRRGCPEMQVYDRGEFPTFKDLAGKARIIRVRAVNPLDTSGDKSVFIAGTDSSDETIYTLNVTDNVQGVFVPVLPPFSDAPMTFNSITGIQKDVTLGQINFYDVDPVTGDETLLVTMKPTETVASYRRYFLNGLPRSCCPLVTDANGVKLVQVDAIVKLNVLPVTVDTDYLILQNEEAIILEAQSMRYSTMDGLDSKAMAKDSHKQAIGLLQGELAHYLGLDKPAISFHPFGSASLERQRIGTMI